MYRFVLVLLILLNSNVLHAQWSSNQIVSDSIQLDISANGSLFNVAGQPAFEVTPGSNNHIFGLAGFWLMGIDGSNVHGSMMKSSSESELWPGPIDTVTGLPTDPKDWNFVWSISKKDIENHRLHYKDNDYVVSKELANWPSKHTQSNVNPILAPFIDWNQDGKYNPMDGDYPSVPGDLNLYFIANDAAGEHNSSGTQKLGIEIQGLVYTIDNSNYGKTVFVRLYVINRSERPYSPFYFGTYTQMELGNNKDNYCGTDIKRNMVFGYNGDNYDENHYRSYLPQGALIYLNKKMHSSVAFNVTDSIRTLPTNHNEFKNVMEGKWRTGADITIGTNGAGIGEKSNFIYFGKSDENHMDKDWTDAQSGDNPGSRSILSVAKQETLPSGGFMLVEMAFAATNGLEMNHIGIEQLADIILDQYGDLSSVSFLEKSDVAIYPNPIKTNGDFVITINEPIYAVEIYDSKGHLVQEVEVPLKISNKIEVRCSENIVAGVYYLKVTSNKHIYNKCLLIVNQ